MALFGAGFALLNLASVVRAEESMLTRLLIKLGRAQVVPDSLPGGKSWNELSLMERIKAYDWHMELWILAAFAVFVVFYRYGCNVNQGKVDFMVNAIKPVLNEQFAVVGANPQNLVIKDSATRYTTYASGRVNVESFLARFRLIDRQSIMNFVASYAIPSVASEDGKPDHVEITITPTDSRSIEPGIFAVANKNCLAEALKEHYFLELTKPLESSSLPSQTFIFLNEHGDQIEMLFTSELRRALSLEGADMVLKWIAFSDVPSTAPKTENDVSSYKKLILVLNIPCTSNEAEAARRIVGASVTFIDALVKKPAYRGSALKRIKANRDAEVAKIRRAEELAKKEELELKKAEERREAAKRERNLSEKEQRKLHKKEQDKQSRKQKQKLTRRA